MLAEEMAIAAWLLGKYKHYLLEDFEFEDSSLKEIYLALKRLYLEKPDYNENDALMAVPRHLQEFALQCEINIPTTANAEVYIEELLQESKQKKIRRLLQQTLEQRNNIVIEELVEQLLKITNKRNEKLSRRDIEIVEQIILEIEEGKEEERFSTGYIKLDTMLKAAMKKGHLIVIAARPAMGKSAFACNLGLNLRLDLRGKARTIAYVTLEMPEEQVIQRFTAAFNPVSTNVLDTKAKDTKAYFEAYGEFACYYPIHVIDKMNIWEDIKLELERIEQKEGHLDAVIIDYAQLMNSKLRFESRRLELDYISRDLKAFAMRHDCLMIALAQLNRAPETRRDHRPILSDLRECGELENSADVVMFLYREAYYDPSANEKDAEIIVAKNRHGKTGTVNLFWAGEYQMFYENITKLQAKMIWDKFKEGMKNE